MKKGIVISILCALAFSACKSEKESSKEPIAHYNSFGAQITVESAMTAPEMLKKFETLQVGDTIAVKFESKIAEVCENKGCWMKLPLDAQHQTMVKFKDYGFFMPLDSKGKDVIVAGKAFVQITSVEELRHYAADAGKSLEEIAKITEPKKEMAFEANGVLIKS